MPADERVESAILGMMQTKKTRATMTRDDLDSLVSLRQRIVAATVMEGVGMVTVWRDDVRAITQAVAHVHRAKKKAKVKR